MALNIRLALFAAVAAVFVAGAMALESSDPGHELKSPAPRVPVTHLGDILIEWAPQRAPLTSATVLRHIDQHYMDQHFYNEVIFHRAIRSFMVQTGGYVLELMPGEPDGAGGNPFVNGLPNQRSAIATARTSDPGGARAQFFINLKDSRRLDADGATPGYTLFGQVISGMDVIDKIAASAVRTLTPEFRHLPVEPMRILYTHRVPAP